ncbi:MAG: ATP-binding protein [Elusimicrobia bacterium]|nr:ATP-binding protein [Elusimicrobiota bacterium]
MKLTTRFFLILLGIAVVPLLLSVAWNIKQYNSSVTSYYDLHKGISSLSAANVDEWFLGVNRDLAFLYEIENPLNKKNISDIQVIQQATRINSDIMSLSMLAKDGKELFFLQSETVQSASPLASYQTELIKRVQASGIVSGGDVLCLSRHAYYPLAYPLVDGRVVVFHFLMDKLLAKINSQETGRTGEVVLTDGRGRALPCQRLRGGKPDPAELLRIFRAGGRTGRLDAITIVGKPYSGAYSAVGKLDWAALSVQTDDELYGRQKKSIFIFSVFAVTVFAITLFVVFLISNRIIGPINNMVNGVKGFLKNQHLDKIIPAVGWPEIKILVGVLNRMMLELQAYRAFQLNQIVEEKNKAQALIDTIPDGVLLIDDRGGLIYSNQTALNLLGIPRMAADVLIPRSVKNEAFYAEFSKLSLSKEKFFRSELEAPLSNTTSTVLKSFRIIANQFMLATLKRHGRVIIIRDISYEKELEKAKEDFFHMITHDMRAPLATIQGYAELLMKKVPPSPSTDKYFKSVLYSSRRLRGMIDDILNTTKLERGTMALQIDKMSAGELITRVCENHEPVAGPKNIKISAPQPAVPIIFNGDPILLERVVTNIVGNALKFTPSGGSITLSCSETADEVLFSVRDTGPGIPEDKRQMIFEKYSQMEEHKSMGFGLGLAMCKMTVELHKGKIWVESEVGKGSDFLFTVSKKMTQEAKPETQAETKA